jgi:hypothetical protein
MKKRDFKKLILMGIATGSMALAQSAEGTVNLESTFAGGAGGCASATPTSGYMNSGDTQYYDQNGQPIRNSSRYEQRGYDNSSYQQNSGCAAQYSPWQRGSSDVRGQRTLDDRGYSQRNIRNNQRQIAESDETMPTDDTTVTTPPTTPTPKKPSGYSNSCGANGCSGSGKNLPRQYRTRN